jgi:hypothetical protein
VDVVDHDATLEAGVDGDLLEGGGERGLHDVRASGLVTGEVNLVEGGGRGVRECHTAAGQQPILELLSVVVRVAGINLHPELSDAARDPRGHRP